MNGLNACGRQRAGFSRALAIISLPQTVTHCLTRPVLFTLFTHQVVVFITLAAILVVCQPRVDIQSVSWSNSRPPRHLKRGLALC
jgi:hypothetical protein